MKKKLGRKTGHRKLMLTNLAISLILYEKIKTTQAKAKQVRSIVEHSINIAKKNNLNSKRLLMSVFLHNKNVVKKLSEDLNKRFNNLDCGYIKTYKTKSRLGDNAPQVILILSKSKFLKNLDSKKTQNHKITKNK